ncbi:hypothetical protein ABH940_006606 [Streptacidiphilus sp. BW17]
MCEQMATSVYAEERVPAMWVAARKRNLSSPDWLSRTPPRGCQLDHLSYARLLRERVARDELTNNAGGIAVGGSRSRVLSTWSGDTYRAEGSRPAEELRDHLENSAGGLGAGQRGVALFSWRGDYRATGRLDDYSCAAPPST